MKATAFRRYFMPGLIFQGVMIGGGYATGRELVEFFLQFGPGGSLVAMFGITLVMWAVLLALTFEFARVLSLYDYRSFMIALIGRFWVVFDICFIIVVVIVLAVAGSVAGVLLRDFFGVPYVIGVGGMLAGVGILTFKGTGLIEKSFSVWSIFIYVVYLMFMVTAVLRFGGDIRTNLASGEMLPGWAMGGFKYGLYNLAPFAAVLFSLRHLETRRQAVLSGVCAAVIGLLPGFLFFIAILGHYPEVVAEEVPAVFVLERTGLPVLVTLYVIMLFGTMIQTGTGFIHGVNDRIQSALQSVGREFPAWQRPVVAISMLLLSLALSKFGVIALVAKGYGTFAWAMFGLYAVPLVTIGIRKIIRSRGSRVSSPSTERHGSSPDQADGNSGDDSR